MRRLHRVARRATGHSVAIHVAAPDVDAVKAVELRPRNRGESAIEARLGKLGDEGVRVMEVDFDTLGLGIRHESFELAFGI